MTWLMFLAYNSEKELPRSNFYLSGLLSLILFLMAITNQSASADDAFVRCGGNFKDYLNSISEVALSLNIPKNTIQRVLSHTDYVQEVIDRDRSQRAFRQSFLDFSQKAVSDYRLLHGKKKIAELSNVFSLVESNFGVPPEVITAFWAMESDFGKVQGTFDTLSALGTLGFDCRRPALFQKQYLAAMKLIESELLDISSVGAWAGEYGQIQMLPSDILKFAKDGDRDGKIDLSSSAEDIIVTAGNKLSRRGWIPGQPWLDEVTVPKNFPWREAGLNSNRRVSGWIKLGVGLRLGNFSTQRKQLVASLILPQGRNGPKFLAYQNFQSFLNWNESFIYSVTAAYLANRLNGNPEYLHSGPENILSKIEIIELQTQLTELGYEVGGIDGIIGYNTRQAVKNMQYLLNLPADGWPTKMFLNLIKN